MKKKRCIQYHSLFHLMCIDLYVDKVLVYTDCVPVPSPVPSVPSVPSPVPSPTSSVPSPVPSPVLSIVPSPVSSIVPSPYVTSNIPSSIPSPATNVISDGYSLITPSIVATTKTMMTPSSSNSSNMTEPYGDNGSPFIQDNQEWMNIVAVVLAVTLPALFICILVYKKKPKKCKKIPNKVQPERMKKKKKKSCCCKDEPQIPEKQNRSTTTGTYLNQPPLPVEEPVYEGTPSAPAMSLPPTPTDK